MATCGFPDYPLIEPVWSRALKRLHVDVGNRVWSEELLSASGISLNQLSELLEGSQLVGTGRDEIEHGKRLPIQVPENGYLVKIIQ